MKRERIGYYDMLNIAATLSVIFLHCNGAVHVYTDTLAWKQALAIEVICYWAVPAFFMLSGATLFEYKKNYDTKTFFIKRFTRTVIPFVIWSFINVWIKGINPFENGIKRFIGDFLGTTYEGIYWFFIPLFAIYLCIPVFAVLVKKREVLWYMCTIGFITISLLPALFKELGISWNYSISMPMMGGYLIYPVLGYLLSRTELKKSYRVIIYILGVLGALQRYVMTYILSEKAAFIDKTYFSYTEYYAFFLASAVFVFFKYSKIIAGITKNKWAAKYIPQIASLSFGVYLLHMIVYRLLTNLITENIWQWRLLVPFLIYGICLIGTYTIRKIPVIKRIIP